MSRISICLCCVACAALNLAGCASRPVQAPVIDRAPAVAPVVARPAVPAAAAAADARPDSYSVKRGDTLYSIALDHGLDYKEFAIWNHLENPNLIRVGQVLRIRPPAGTQEAPVIVSPISASGRVETRPLGPSRPAATEGVIKSEPRARKLPYSAENLALLQQGAASPRPEPAPPQPLVPKPEPAATGESGNDEDRVEWGWPAHGKILAGFSEATNKGMDIAGTLGDPVIASGPGRVVYSGSGLRGYGKLVIIKHNKTYLSAYAHNRDILVKEGQNVVKGQKIAEIGNTDTDAPKLHFEIRKLGKPVDPVKFLPPT